MPESHGNYDYNKNLEYNYFKYFDEIYEYDERKKMFRENEASKYLFYSKFKIIRTSRLTS